MRIGEHSLSELNEETIGDLFAYLRGEKTRAQREANRALRIDAVLIQFDEIRTGIARWVDFTEYAHLWADALSAALEVAERETEDA